MIAMRRGCKRLDTSTHKASTQKAKQVLKIQIISMVNSQSHKSCHSDQLSRYSRQSAGNDMGNETPGAKQRAQREQASDYRYAVPGEALVAIWGLERATTESTRANIQRSAHWQRRLVFGEELGSRIRRPGSSSYRRRLCCFELLPSASQAMELSAGTSKTVGGSHASVIHTLHTWHSNVWIERTNRIASPQLGQHGAG